MINRRSNHLEARGQILFLASLFFCHVVLAQTDETDISPDAFHSYLRLAEASVNEDLIGHAKLYAKNAIRVSENKQEYIQACRMLALVYARTGEYDSSVSVCQSLLPIVREAGDSIMLSKILNTYGIGLLFKSRYEDALKVFYENISIRRAQSDSSALAVSLNNVGLLYYKMLEFKRSSAYYEEALSIKQAIEDTTGNDLIKINLALSYLKAKKISKADSVIVMMDEVDLERTNLEAAIGYHFCKGVILYEDGDKKHAVDCFEKSLTLASEPRFRRFQLDNLDYLIKHHTEEHDLKTSKLYIDLTLRILSEDSTLVRERITLYGRLISYYKLLGNDRNIIEFQDRYIRLKDSLYHVDFLIKMMSVEVDFQERENIRQIELQSKSLSMQNKIIKGQRLLVVTASLGGIVLFLLLIVLYKNVRRKQRLNELLERKVQERTSELQLQISSMNSSQELNERLIHKLDMRLAETCNTINNLCDIALKEVVDPVAVQYIKEMSKMLIESRTSLPHHEKG